MAGLRLSPSKFDSSWEGQRPFLEGFARSLSTPAHQTELNAILSVSSDALSYQDLLHFARRLQAEEKLGPALELYAWLDAQAAIPDAVKLAATQEANALQGKGSFGARAEVLLKQVLKESTDGRVIAPMLGASIIGSLCKTLVMGRLLGQPVALLTRGSGASFAAGAFGFGAEGLAFAGFGRAMGPTTGEGFGQDLARSYIGLGALKLSGSLGRKLLPASPAMGAASWMQRGVQASTPQATMFLGMLTAHKLETRLGLRPVTDSDHLFADTLAAMISLQVGTKLGHAALGSRFHSFQQELEIRNRTGPSSPSLERIRAVFGGRSLGDLVTPEGFRFPGILLSEGGKATERKKRVETRAQGKAKGDRKVFELKASLNFADPKRWTEAEIGEVVKAIVMQDAEFFPGGNVEPMSTGRSFRDRRYRVNDEILSLSTLTYRVRQARGLKADSRVLSDLQIVREWKERWFGWRETNRTDLELTGEFSFSDPKRWTEEEIGQVVKTIVVRDAELYPGGDVGPMSTHPRYYSLRWYRINGRDLRLVTLARWFRRARGLKTDDSKALSDLQILREWKERWFGWKETSRADLVLAGEFRFADPRHWTEDEIGEVVKAIVAQDVELYPGRNAGPMSVSRRHFVDRRYRVDGEDVSLSTLAYRFRQIRALKTDDTKILPNSQIIREWKERWFGWKETSRAAREIAREFEFSDPKRWTETEIGEVVRAIVAQDTELFPDGNVSPMSSGPLFSDRWYRINGEVLNLSTLVRRVRQARGLGANDTKSLANLQIVREWKERWFGWKETNRVDLELAGEFGFADPKRWTEEEVGAVVKAIVAQDAELYPGGNAKLMSASDRMLIERRYRVNEESLNLSNLAHRIRRARGLKASDSTNLPSSQIVREWKERWFGVKEASRADLALANEFRFADPKRWSEEEIGEVVKAIVAQDTELYPGGDVGAMAAGHRYLSDRWYRINGEDLSLYTLVRRVRQVRGIKANDLKSLPSSQIIREWKERWFGWRETSRADLALAGEFRFADPKLWTENEIGAVVRAIVAQDIELYPGGDPEKLSTGAKYYSDRWYRVNDIDLTLDFLSNRVRQARGLRPNDSKTLPNSQIIGEWKERWFGWRKTSRADLELAGEFHFADPKRWTEEEIGQVVKAIVAQDTELYSEGIAALMPSSVEVFFSRWYRLNGEDLILSTLARRVRKARGMKSTDWKILPDSQIVREWKERLFGWKEPDRESLELTGEFSFAHPKRWTEGEIEEVVKAIVAQDNDLYPNGDVGPMSSGARYFPRWYRVNGKEVSLQTLVGKVRRARGLKNNDSKALPTSQIIREWKRRLGVLQFADLTPSALEGFIRNADLQSLLDLFGKDPAHLVEALSFLKQEAFKNKDVAEFVKAYVGLQVESGGVKQRRIELDPWQRRRNYLQAVLEALQRGDALDLSEGNFSSQLQLLIRLSRKSFEEAPERLIEEFDRMATLAGHPFLRRLQAEAADYFLNAKDFKTEEMRSLPYGYQREGAYFLTTHDRAILADEAGMGKTYQVIAAAESLGLKRILWVTTAANKETLREEIFQHSQVKYEAVKVVISGDLKERQAQIRSLNGERYLITNYETLAAMQKTDPEGYVKLSQGLDLIVVDEAQLTDNVETLRTQAIQNIDAPRRWLLTATPYQSRPERMWSLLHWLKPEQYPDFNAFKQLYSQSTHGLLLLHSELSKILLRRTKRDTLYTFKSAEEVPFDRQLKDGIPRLPEQVRVAPEQGGSYELSVEQADLIAWMTADFKGWAQHYNRHLPNGSEPIDLDNLNALLKFDTIQKVIYSPEHFGITAENPLFSALDKRIAQRLANGEKVILWAWNTATVDALERRYQNFGVRRIDGGVVGLAREEARHAFQENPKVNILVANYQSGGVGLTLTAAHAAIFVQLPQVYPTLYQAEGRHQRLIGINNVRHAKDRVFVEWMLPKFPQGFVEGMEETKLKDILSHGTLVEQTRKRLEGGETLYQLLMEGYGKVEDLDRYFKVGLLEGMGLTGSEPLDYVSHLKGRARNYAETAKSLLPLWKLAKGAGDAEQAALHLVELLKDSPQLAQRTGEAFSKAKHAYPEDLNFIASLFEIKNKHIRTQVLRHAPEILELAYGQGKSLHELIAGLKVGKLSPASFLTQVYLRSGAGGKVVEGISRTLNQTRDTPVKRYLEEHFFSGALAIMESPAAWRLLAEKQGLFPDAVSLADRIHVVYRLGLLARTRSDLLESLQRDSFESFPAFAKALEGETQRALAEFAGRSPAAVEVVLSQNPEWRGNVDPLLALLAGYREGTLPNSETLLEQYRTSLAHLLDGDYREWRNHSPDVVEYLADQHGFWKAFSQNRSEGLGDIQVSPQKVQATLRKDYLSLSAEYLQEGAAVEGPWVYSKLEEYRQSDPKTRATFLSGYQGEISQLGRALVESSPGEEALRVLEKYDLPAKPGFTQKAIIQEKLSELRNLVAWIRLDQGFQVLGKGEGIDRRTLLRDLDAKARYYRSRKYDKMAEHFAILKEALEQYGAETISFKNLTIEDTDDPAILARMGALHPELTNCFNPNGNPVFHQFIVSALGSKNMKMVVVREGAQVVALAMAKVKRLEDGTPVLFLERGLYRKGYDFRKEMLDHLQNIAKQMSPMPVVMTQIDGKPRPDDPQVLGTGSYTGTEYVEPVFGLRSSEHTKHRGRVVGMKAEMTTTKPYGIGTSNLTMEAYIQDLKAQGIQTVVDVRAQPFSRFRPHFNREQMQAALHAAGIKYVWMGDSLGNPKDPKGERSLEGFQTYMQMPTYSDGLSSLKELIARSPGRVAITCAEAKECDCHRKFILEDLAKP